MTSCLIVRDEFYTTWGSICSDTRTPCLSRPPSSGPPMVRTRGVKIGTLLQLLHFRLCPNPSRSWSKPCPTGRRSCSGRSHVYRTGTKGACPPNQAHPQIYPKLDNALTNPCKTGGGARALFAPVCGDVYRTMLKGASHPKQGPPPKYQNINRTLANPCQARGTPSGVCPCAWRCVQNKA